jgi:predicted nucleotide-binding protein
MVRFDTIFGFKESADYMFKCFANEPEPNYAKEARKILKNRLSQFGNKRIKKIILFGSGNNGKLILEELICRGIKIDSFVDNNKTDALGNIPCNKVKEEIIKNALVIITPDDTGYEIRNQLFNNGCTNWMTYQDIMPILKGVPVQKKLFAGGVK